MVPLGIAHPGFGAASEKAPPETGRGDLMFEASRTFTTTGWAWTSDKKHEPDPEMWDARVRAAQNAVGRAGRAGALEERK